MANNLDRRGVARGPCTSCSCAGFTLSPDPTQPMCSTCNHLPVKHPAFTGASMLISPVPVPAPAPAATAPAAATAPIAATPARQLAEPQVSPNTTPAPPDFAALTMPGRGRCSTFDCKCLQFVPPVASQTITCNTCKHMPACHAKPTASTLAVPDVGHVHPPTYEELRAELDRERERRQAAQEDLTSSRAELQRLRQELQTEKANHAATQAALTNLNGQLQARFGFRA
eukprot:m.63623 g.63623  ORF g.63623 m.63623 type:complete len:228 (+) comp49655_c0_seq3:211-894(+)